MFGEAAKLFDAHCSHNKLQREAKNRKTDRM